MQSVDKKLYLRGKGNTIFFDLENETGVQWVLSAEADCSGNIQTLLNWENPPMDVTSNCYIMMFRDCTNLTTAPELPTTTLAKGCYNNMFSGCTSLTTAPELPATTLVESCYYMMFYLCTKLKVNTTNGNIIFTCPSTIPKYAVDDMFTFTTDGTFRDTPTAGNTYYYTE